MVKQKPLEEILESTKDFKKILIAGCNECPTIYQVGGEKQAILLSSLIEMNKKMKQKNVTAKPMVVLRQCDKEITSTALKPLIDDYDVVLSLACGAGVQTIAEMFPEKQVIAGCDTMGIGGSEREPSSFSELMLSELCKGCGECLLNETGSICPITRCAKALLNGPCGGMLDEKCEVGDYKNDCGWVLIFNRLKTLGRLDLFTKFRPPRDNRLFQNPRQIEPKQVEIQEEEKGGK